MPRPEPRKFPIMRAGVIADIYEVAVGNDKLLQESYPDERFRLSSCCHDACFGTYFRNSIWIGRADRRANIRGWRFAEAGARSFQADAFHA